MQFLKGKLLATRLFLAICCQFFIVVYCFIFVRAVYKSRAGIHRL